MAEREPISGESKKKRWSKSTKALVAITAGGVGTGLVFMPVVGAVTTAVVAPFWAAKLGVAGYRRFRRKG